MEKIAVSTQLLNAILGYLGDRPYKETFQLIAALQKEASEAQTHDTALQDIDDGKPAAF
jgi:hypothetical protein